MRVLLVLQAIDDERKVANRNVIASFSILARTPSTHQVHYIESSFVIWVVANDAKKQKVQTVTPKHVFSRALISS